MRADIETKAADRSWFLARCQKVSLRAASAAAENFCDLMLERCPVQQRNDRMRVENQRESVFRQVVRDWATA